ncbi:Gfo/Idh/MocA family protein [Halorientalis brevis]|uniref:Gfo/Idh/MocA family protein n=1 Tax=Halorientalis brevis TaxID=1126241 RepID=A0ABD6C9F9_9EURY|nr:Gfo/Idh/MocA family oxidoreductase [Halorientalis brevis]
MRVLLTGLGSIGQRHARLLKESSKDIELIAYRSGTSTSGNDLGIREYTRLEDALDTDPDIAFITNPTAKHVETALSCAKADCDLFVEKPLSHDLDRIDELIAIADERNLVTYVGCQLRFDPVLNATRDRLDDGELGTVISFRTTAGSYLPDWRPGRDYRDSYSADPDRGGGVVLDLIHEIDYLHWLFGPLRCIASDLGYTDTLDIESEAIAEAIVRTSDDVLGSIHLDYCRRQPRRTLEVVCENGTLVADLEDRILTVKYPSSTETETFDYDRDERFRKQLAYFLEHIDTRAACENDLREGKEVLQVALDIKRGHDE